MNESAAAPALRIAPPAFLADAALRAVLAALPRARLIGGCVRDTLAGLPVQDIDLATPDPPEAVAEALRRAGLRVLPTGLDHGTLTALAEGRGFEITTLRRDVETDGRHARVTFHDDWRADAERRDFTINALSMTPDGTVFDYLGGIADLGAGSVRFVGDAARRIAEDRLRVLRFFRFQTRYGRVPPDAPTRAALAAAAPDLAALSPERVWSELKRILAAPDPREAVALMARLGVLAAVLPEGVAPARLDRLLAAGAPNDALLRLAALLHGDADRCAARLRLSGAERARLAALRRCPAPWPSADAAALRRLLADTPGDILAGRAWLIGAGAALPARLLTMPRPRFPLAGRDALAAGMAPGPAVGAALAAVRRWWRAAGCTADAAACLAELARWRAG